MTRRGDSATTKPSLMIAITLADT